MLNLFRRFVSSKGNNWRAGFKAGWAHARSEMDRLDNNPDRYEKFETLARRLAEKGRTLSNYNTNAGGFASAYYTLWDEARFIRTANSYPERFWKLLREWMSYNDPKRIRPHYGNNFVLEDGKLCHWSKLGDQRLAGDM